MYIGTIINLILHIKKQTEASEKLSNLYIHKTTK